jgi:hypothetical protein
MRTLCFCITRGRFEFASIPNPAAPAIVAVCRRASCHRRFRSELATGAAIQRSGGGDDHTGRARAVLCVLCGIVLGGVRLVEIIIVGISIISAAAATRATALPACCARGSCALGSDSARAVGRGRLFPRQGFGYACWGGGSEETRVKTMETNNGLPNVFSFIGCFAPNLWLECEHEQCAKWCSHMAHLSILSHLIMASVGALNTMAAESQRRALSPDQLALCLQLLTHIVRVAAPAESRSVASLGTLGRK